MKKYFKSRTAENVNLTPQENYVRFKFINVSQSMNILIVPTRPAYQCIVYWIELFRNVH